MEGARSPIGKVELKTGVADESGVLKEIEFRELSGLEEDILSSRKMKVSDRLTRIMQNCTLRIGNISAAESRQKVASLVEKMVATDRWFYLINIRVLSVGSNYVFETTCPECETTDKVTYDLKNVSIKDAPVADKLWFESDLPSGRKVRWRVADAKVDAKIEELSNDTNAATAALFARIETIDGKPASMLDVTGMNIKDRNHLRKEIDAKEGDIDDEVKFKCPKCGHEYPGEMPFDPRGFFYPVE